MTAYCYGNFLSQYFYRALLGCGWGWGVGSDFSMKFFTQEEKKDLGSMCYRLVHVKNPLALGKMLPLQTSAGSSPMLNISRLGSATSVGVFFSFCQMGKVSQNSHRNISQLKQGSMHAYSTNTMMITTSLIYIPPPPPNNNDK